MSKEMETAIAHIVRFAHRCAEYPCHWVNGKNFAVKNGIDKDTAKAAALYVVAKAEKLNVKIKKVRHGSHLTPADYFAGNIH